MEQRRRQRLRRQWISTIASGIALCIALGLMAIADVGPTAPRPERVLDFGAGPRVNHAGNGNALIPDNSTPVAHPAAVPGAVDGPPISANIVAVRPVVAVDDLNDVVITTTTTTVAPRPAVKPTTTTTTTTTTTVSPMIHLRRAHRQHRPHTPHHPAPKHKPHKHKNEKKNPHVEDDSRRVHKAKVHANKRAQKHRD